MTQKKKKRASRHPPRAVKQEVNPSYVIKVGDPKMLRKDLLEALRELIIFMQGYEKFRKIQEEKITQITALKHDVKDLSAAINHKLRKYLPKGKLAGVMPEKKESEEFDHRNEMLSETLSSPRSSPSSIQSLSDGGGLDELESQLKDIERQIQKIK